MSRTAKRAGGDKPAEGDAERVTLAPEESAWDRFMANVRTVGGAVLLAVFIRIVLFEAFEIEGPSMEPTLQNGDRVVVAKMLYGLYLPWAHEAVLTWGAPHLGDVVIVHSPADEVDIVKRVIGTPGDIIEVRDRRMYRNGEALPYEDLGPCSEDEQLDIDPFSDCTVFEESIGDLSYRVSDSESPIWDMDPVEVPDGHVFVRGDHRDRSNDSTRIGTIPVERVKGRALFIYLSCEDEPGGWWICDHARWDRFFDMVR